ncbi:uncharacterized protein P174DRAFT_305139 [Aspergillus novofumigatus IBT 16806]|uniref:Uncharacterized protein n=1 Tax=Aspergillus novofumigatus (strain IBT 16806) TaxID=1392255 RepID=A0A2I1BWG1_ASPN1|nr:uncharacterized protein P174DRAFT_305139 [Aspergillus novofumigatus IBT 16806]PKX89724.1 hypothetical protein P174DRAFT_305139 [Aspergillus novofumigatus IBT 16806]
MTKVSINDNMRPLSIKLVSSNENQEKVNSLQVPYFVDPQHRHSHPPTTIFFLSTLIFMPISMSMSMVIIAISLLDGFSSPDAEAYGRRSGSRYWMQAHHDIILEYPIPRSTIRGFCAFNTRGLRSVG